MKLNFISVVLLIFFLIVNQNLLLAQEVVSNNLNKTDTAINDDASNKSILEEVSLLGSRSLTPRTKIESPVPVDVISAKEIQKTGQIDLGQMLQFSTPSFNSTKFAISNVTSFVDPATLRGLGPDQTLVLVNGKRRHQSAALNPNNTVGRGTVGTDLNSIPTLAIEKIEILRDGAAAQYGSDAIGGIINIVLKKEIGLIQNIYVGQSKQGDGTTYDHSLNYGLPLGKNGGFLNITGWLHYNSPTNRGGYFDNSKKVYNSVQRVDDSIISARNFDRNVSRYGQAENLTFSGFYNLELPIARTKLSLYSFGGWTQKDLTAYGFFRQPINSARTVVNTFPNGYAPEFPGVSNDVSLVVGINRNVKNDSKWYYDFSSGFGSNVLSLYANNTINPSWGDASPTKFYTGSLLFQQSSTNFNVVRNFSIGTLKSFILSAGTEFRWENYQILAGDEASWKPGLLVGKDVGSSGREGFSPENARNKSRYNIGVYTDIETELNKYLLLTGAVRFENYSDFGPNISGKIAARLKINNYLSIRTAYNRGFRAPSLHQINYSNYGDVQWIANIPYPVANLRNDEPYLKNIGIENLKAETSNNYSLGITSKFKSFLLTIDAYQINIYDRVVMSGQLDITKSPINQNFQGLRASKIQFFTNAINTTTRGLDIVGTFKRNFYTKQSLQITMALMFNATDSIDIAKIKTPQVFMNQQVSLMDRIGLGLIELAQPKNKQILTLNYEYKPIGITFRATRFGQVTARQNNPLLDQTLSPKIVLDASIIINIKNSSLTIGANNFTNEYPDKVKDLSLTQNGQETYSRQTSQFGFMGTFYYASLILKL